MTMNAEEITAAVAGWSILVMLVTLGFPTAYFVLLLCGLSSCMRHQRDLDRLTWVVIIIFVPIFGAILYFSMANRPGYFPPGAPVLPRPVPVSPARKPDPDVAPVVAQLDTAAEKRRAQEINAALRKTFESNIRPKT